MPAKFTFDDKRLKQNLHTLPPRVKAMLAIFAEYEAAYATGWIKMNAPWTDRTGAARTGLVAVPQLERQAIGIIMAYSVEYGIWLEVAHNRKYEIIQSAMRIIGEKMIRDLNGLLEKAATL